MYEQKQQKIAPVSVFMKRMVVHISMAFLLSVIVLFMGIAGYHWIAGLGWIDSLLEASMILGGMGPVNHITTTGAKIFASGYALFSGLVFIALIGIVLAPAVHRMLHTFHADERDI
jgi:hypothetical protein